MIRDVLRYIPRACSMYAMARDCFVVYLEIT